MTNAISVAAYLTTAC